MVFNLGHAANFLFRSSAATAFLALWQEAGWGSGGKESQIVSVSEFQGGVRFLSFRGRV